jgi:quinol monooxygenase YgiN
MEWPTPVVAGTPEPDSGPVMVTVEYRIRPGERDAFIAAVEAVGEMRRRNGAYFWELFHDPADPDHLTECFMDESWVEHLRQHERLSIADRDILNFAKRHLVEGQTTKTTHWLGSRNP